VKNCVITHLGIHWESLHIRHYSQGLHSRRLQFWPCSNTACYFLSCRVGFKSSWKATKWLGWYNSTQSSHWAIDVYLKVNCSYS